MKCAGIYNPYWDTMGGGEKYTASVVKGLLRAGYEVEIYWHDSKLVKKIADRFGISIEKAVISKVLPSKFQQFKLDLLFWVSDGSVPLMMGKKNILHFQVPFNHVHGLSLSAKIKQLNIHHVVCNSNFTKKVVDAE